MSSSRNRQFPLEIYQDPQPPYEQHYTAAPTYHMQPQFQPLQPSHDAMNHVFYPAQMQQHAQLSPLKNDSPASSPHLDLSDAAFFDAVALPAPVNRYVADSPLKRHFDASNLLTGEQKPQKGFFATFASFKTMDKENVYARPATGDYTLKSDPPFYRGVLGKRAAAGSDTIEYVPSFPQAKKQKLDSDDADMPLPEPSDMPIVLDEGGKPPYSYAQLIGMAILRAPNRRLTLAQIYKWISDTFSFYREGEAGWTNSIRHNLSLNKAFVKRERPKDDPGKGNYWAIEAGMEKQFLRENNKMRKGTADLSSQTGLSSDAVRPPTASGPVVPSANSADSRKPAATQIAPTKFAAQPDISSDATQPASEDNADHDKPAEASLLQSSPPPSLPQPDHLRSSPPLAPSRRGTPKRHRPARSIDMKKQSDTFRDSGFYSSLESSVTRPHAPHPSIGSDADHDRRPASKRSGRAEDEIARMRGSSFDPSPSKPKSVFKQPGLPASQMLSSPLRSRQGFPLTPGLKLRPSKPMLKPPPTVSPNTHLRKHRESVRELVGTPGHSLGQLLANDEFKNSPAFFLNNEFSPWKFGQDLHGPSPLKRGLSDFDDGLSVWNDNAQDLAGLYDSPLKRSTIKAARPALQRSHTTTGVGNDVHGSDFRLASPIRLFPHLDDCALDLESPTKRGQSKCSEPLPKLTVTADELWGADSTDSDDDLGGLDMTKGFRSIGVRANLSGCNKENQPSDKPEKAKFAPVKTSRPPLGRSSTNIF